MSHSPSPSAEKQPTDNAHHHEHDFTAHKQVYWVVGTALLVGTVVTVLARYWEFNSVALTVAVALFIASIKAFLVGSYFMHLISEKKAIYLVLATTAAFALGMAALILLSDKDPIHGAKSQPMYHVP